MYLIGLVESSLETLPEPLQNTKKAVALAKRYKVSPSELLLDKSIFYEEMKKLPNFEKRGRPDIVHQFLLATQYSYLNKLGLLKVFIHTINDNIIEVDNLARIPKNYYQFVGLMQQLFKRGRVPPLGRPLLTLKKELSLRDYLESLGVKKPILLHEKGRLIANKKELLGFIFPPYCFLIGGFPHGDFSPAVQSLATDLISLNYEMIFDSWLAADRLICILEEYVGSSKA